MSTSRCSLALPSTPPWLTGSTEVRDAHTRQSKIASREPVLGVAHEPKPAVPLVHQFLAAVTSSSMSWVCSLIVAAL